MPATAFAHADAGSCWGHIRQQSKLASVNTLSICNLIGSFSASRPQDGESTWTRFASRALIMTYHGGL